MKSFVSHSIKQESEEVDQIKYSKTIAFCILIGLSVLVCCPIVFLISKAYTDFVWFLYGVENKVVNENHTLELIFYIFKTISLLVLVWIMLVWYDFLNEKKGRSTRLVQKIAESLSSSVQGNKSFFYSLKKETRFIVTIFFAVLFIAILYFIVAIPLQYDEWVSYSIFTSQGFWTTLSNYSTTNNHIFSNLIVCIFVKLPFDPEITMRLPNVLITLLCMWYFFKICKYCFNDTISIILLVFVITPYPFVMYAFAARGYMALNLFCVLMMYSSFQLSENYKNKKYRILFILSLVLGTFSMPTFIYAIFPVCIVLGIYVIKQKPLSNLFLFVKDGFISGALIFFCYSFVLLFNDFHAMMGLNGFSNKFSLRQPGTFEKISSHLKSVFSYLFYDEGFLPAACVLILVSTFLYLIKAKSRSTFICLLSTAMFFSPVLILVLQRVIPFDRNWLFLIFPSALCLGFIIYSLVNLISFNVFVQFMAKYKLGINALIVSLAIFSLSRFTASHANFSYLDFELKALREKHLNAVVRNIREISMTKKGHEFYAADVIWYLCLKSDPKRNIVINELTLIENQDILIIDKKEVERFKDKLNNYKFLMDLDNMMNVYGRSELF